MPLQTVPLSVLDILRSIPDSVLTIDRDKRIVALNGPAEALTGISEVAADGRACGAVLGSEICDTERCPFDRALVGGETVTNFNVLRRDATGTRWMRVWGDGFMPR
jgi:PAS domain-containing protein